MTLGTIIAWWNKFWFEPSSPTPHALYRIILGLVLLQDAVIMRFTDWRIFYSTHPLIPLNDYISHWWGREPRFDIITLLPETDFCRLCVLALYMLLLLFMTLGLYTRQSALGALLINESLFNQFLLNLSGADVFLKLSMMMIAFSNAGDAFSLDNLRRTWRQDWRKTGFRPPLKPQWALRMMQVQVAYVYLITGLVKLGEPKWIDGTALFYVVRYEDLIRFQIPYLFANMWTSKLLAWLSIAFECTFPYLVWIKELRYFMLLWGVLFHVGIDMTVNIPLFEWIFIGSYINFVAPEDLTKVWNYVKLWVRKCFGPPHAVRYDVYDLGQIKLAGVLHRLDIFGRLAIEPSFSKLTETALKTPNVDSSICAPPMSAETAGNTTKVISSHRSLEVIADGKSFTGFRAFQIISLNVPMLWALLPVVIIPGFSFLSKQVFLLLCLHNSEVSISANSKAVGLS